MVVRIMVVLSLLLMAPSMRAQSPDVVTNVRLSLVFENAAARAIATAWYPALGIRVTLPTAVRSAAPGDDILTPDHDTITLSIGRDGAAMTRDAVARSLQTAIEGADAGLFGIRSTVDTSDADGSHVGIHVHLAFAPRSPRMVSAFSAGDLAPGIDARPRLMTTAAEYGDLLALARRPGSRQFADITTLRASAADMIAALGDSGITSVRDNASADRFRARTTALRRLAVLSYIDMAADPVTQPADLHRAADAGAIVHRELADPARWPRAFVKAAGWSKWWHGIAEGLRDWSVAIDLLEATPFRGTDSDMRAAELALQTFAAEMSAKRAEDILLYGIDRERNNWRIRIGSALMMAAMCANTQLMAVSPSGADPKHLQPLYWYTKGANDDLTGIMLDELSNDGNGYMEGPSYLEYSLALALPAMYSAVNFWGREATENHSLLGSETRARQLVSFAQAIMPNGWQPDIPDDATFSSGQMVYAYLSRMHNDLYPALYRGLALADGRTLDDEYGPGFFAWCRDRSPAGIEVTEEFLVWRDEPAAQPPQRSATVENAAAGFAILRSGWSPDDSYLYFNTEYGRLVSFPVWPAPASHEQHDDQSIILYDGGRPLVIDNGYQTASTRQNVAKAADHNTVSEPSYEQRPLAAARRYSSPVVTIDGARYQSVVETAHSAVRHIDARHLYRTDGADAARIRSDYTVFDFPPVPDPGTARGSLYWHGDNTDGGPSALAHAQLDGEPYAGAASWFNLSQHDPFMTITVASNFPVRDTIETDDCISASDPVNFSTNSAYRVRLAGDARQRFISAIRPAAHAAAEPRPAGDTSPRVSDHDTLEVVEAYANANAAAGRGVALCRRLSARSMWLQVQSDTTITVTNPALACNGTTLMPAPGGTMSAALLFTDGALVELRGVNIAAVRDHAHGRTWFECTEGAASTLVLWRTPDTVRCAVYAGPGAPVAFRVFVSDGGFTIGPNSGDATAAGSMMEVRGAGDVTADAVLAPVSAADGAPRVLPDAPHLEQNYPNPFSGTTTIRFSLPARAHARIAIQDALGREVAHLVDTDLPAGAYAERFDTGRLEPGIYIVTLRAMGTQSSRKMIVKNY